MDEVLGSETWKKLGGTEDTVRALLGWFLTPGTLVQLLTILLALVLGHVLGGVLEARLEDRVRTIRQRPRLLRFLALLLRRTRWIVTAALFGVGVLLLNSLRHPDAVVRLVFALVAAWLAISVVSRLIRNRPLARIVAWVAWVVVALHLTGTFGTVRSSLDAVAIEAGSARISIWFMLQAIVIVGVLLWAAIALGDMVEQRVAKNQDLTPSLRVLIGKLVKIALLVLAGGVALNLLGISLGALAFFGGALGLGIGFGLQKVVSNFVSGIIILLDKSIKPGDTIAIGETFGWVRSLRARFVSVITRDGREYLIPNEDFVTQRVENWSFTDTLVRIDVTFGVSYDSDPHSVRKLAIEAAKTIDRVQATPQPVCHLTGFGESSLDFILRFWIEDPQNGVTNVRGAALLACWDAFKAAGIQIPFPHREIIMRTPVEVRS